MKLVPCAIILAASLVACRRGDRAAAPAGSDSLSTAATATGAVGAPVDPDSSTAPSTAKGATTPRGSSASARTDPVVARIAGPSAVLRSRGRSPAHADSGAARHAKADTGATDTTSGASTGTVKVNQFMSYDKANKRVELQVYAAFDHSLGGFNFNGGFQGNQTITVPQGWSIEMHVVNKDAIPHSAIIIPAATPLPSIPDKAAIPAAYTTHLTDGLAPGGGSDTMRFKASPAGSYFLACGVPGHASSGMYVRFDVSASAPAPTYKR